MSVLLTRPEPESREVARELAGHEIGSLIWPLTRIEVRPAPVEIPDGTEGLIFSSVNAVRAFAAGHPGRTLTVLAVGERTAAVARSLGFGDVRAAGGDARSLAGLAARSGLTPLFHPRGRESAAEMAAMLAPAGIVVADRVVYAAEPAGPPPAPIAAALVAGEVRVVTLWSAANARIFREHWQRSPLIDLGRMAAVAISARAAEPLDVLGFGSIFIADRPGRPEMIRAIREAHAALCG